VALRFDLKTSRPQVVVVSSREMSRKQYFKASFSFSPSFSKIGLNLSKKGFKKKNRPNI
jgi:hypothetical protein